MAWAAPWAPSGAAPLWSLPNTNTVTGDKPEFKVTGLCSAGRTAWTESWGHQARRRAAGGARLLVSLWPGGNVRRWCWILLCYEKILIAEDWWLCIAVQLHFKVSHSGQPWTTNNLDKENNFSIYSFQTKIVMVLEWIPFAVPPTLGWGSLGDITEVQFLVQLKFGTSFLNDSVFSSHSRDLFGRLLTCWITLMKWLLHIQEMCSDHQGTPANKCTAFILSLHYNLWVYFQNKITH